MSDSIFAKENKYGYRLNVNHVNVKPHYERFKHKKGGQVLFDEERIEFEDILLEHIRKQKEKANEIKVYDNTKP